MWKNTYEEGLKPWNVSVMPVSLVLRPLKGFLHTPDPGTYTTSKNPWNSSLGL
jgi:hypothetical protein